MELDINYNEMFSMAESFVPQDYSNMPTGSYHDNCHKKMEYVCVNIPYPQICVTVKNPKFASMLTRPYAGFVSATTAFMQYSYQSAVLKRRYPDLAETLCYIAMVQRRHIEMLAELICALGGDPRYNNTCDKSCAYWNATYVDYSKTPRMILLCNIEGTKKIIAEYRNLIKMICDENVDAVLKRIIMDEERHMEIFKECLASYSEPMAKFAYDMGYRKY